ncbi:MAG: BCCT family transporter [Arcanobacterium sp.]|nr:BCCT family transporter [Arcanobacterium sp.]
MENLENGTKNEKKNENLSHKEKPENKENLENDVDQHTQTSQNNETQQNKSKHQDPQSEPPVLAEQNYDGENSATQELAAMLDSTRALETHVEPEIEMEGDAEGSPIDWKIVIPAFAIIGSIVIWGLAFPANFSNFTTAALNTVITNFGWAFILFTTIFLVFAISIALSRFGEIRLCRPDEAPEFSTPSWIAMMFAAGMGIGLMFYGASEPLTHYREGVPGHEPFGVSRAMANTMLHWTLHPWAIYSIVGLAIGYSTYRLGRRQLLSSSFDSVLGKHTWAKRVIDTLAIIATVFGTACSLGVGATQIAAGLDAAGIVKNPAMSTIIMIVSVLTLAFLLSAISGVGKGIQYISNANMILAAALAIFVFALGPTVTILNLLPGTIGGYLSNFLEMVGRTAEFANGSAGEWTASWTIFYWAWWISWSPFVGMFLARISRGRTIREFIIGVMIVPSLLSVLWFAIFGGTAIHLEQTGRSIWGEGSPEHQLFDLLHTFPGGSIIGVIAMILLATFFITSADSASTVMGSMSQSGQSNANRFVSAAWGVLVALIGLTMLITGGDDTLSNLQNLTIIAASPFLIVIICLMFALVRDLRNDEIYLDYREQQRFARKLAKERRIIREQKERDLKRRRRQKKHHRISRG